MREGVVVGPANHTLLIARDSTERPIDDSASPIHNELGAVAGVVLMFRDITDRRRQEQEVREAFTATAQRTETGTRLSPSKLIESRFPTPMLGHDPSVDPGGDRPEAPESSASSQRANFNPGSSAGAPVALKTK